MFDCQCYQLVPTYLKFVRISQPRCQFIESLRSTELNHNKQNCVQFHFINDSGTRIQARHLWQCSCITNWQIGIFYSYQNETGNRILSSNITMSSKIVFLTRFSQITPALIHIVIS
ncbi:Hypothetical_protein [Hexamita inflata]|uniref:Hypothetical_protein n=1 Tax=Hexamita inflata TaxID=28002 RepID=A0AA86PGS3_9EUKA|nr:Hypothetical protein HINF_LOCUS25993 [Hexamita inflata]